MWSLLKLIVHYMLNKNAAFTENLMTLYTNNNKGGSSVISHVCVCVQDNLGRFGWKFPVGAREIRVTFWECSGSYQWWSFQINPDGNRAYKFPSPPLPVSFSLIHSFSILLPFPFSCFLSPSHPAVPFHLPTMSLSYPVLRFPSISCPASGGGGCCALLEVCTIPSVAWQNALHLLSWLWMTLNQHSTIINFYLYLI